MEQEVDAERREAVERWSADDLRPQGGLASLDDAGHLVVDLGGCSNDPIDLTGAPFEFYVRRTPSRENPTLRITGVVKMTLGGDPGTTPSVSVDATHPPHFGVAAPPGSQVECTIRAVPSGTTIEVGQGANVELKDRLPAVILLRGGRVSVLWQSEEEDESGSGEEGEPSITIARGELFVGTKSRAPRLTLAQDQESQSFLGGKSPELSLANGQIRAPSLDLGGQRLIVTNAGAGGQYRLSCEEVLNGGLYLADSRTRVAVHYGHDLQIEGPGGLTVAPLGRAERVVVRNSQVSILESGVLDDVSGQISTLTLHHHALMIGGDEPPRIEGIDNLESTSVVERVTTPTGRDAIGILEKLENVQRVSLELGSFRRRRPSRREALEDERALNMAVNLLDRRCGNGRTRADFRMQQLRVQRALADTPTDRRILTARIVTGATVNLHKCFCTWLAGAVIGTFFMIISFGKQPWRVDLDADSLVTTTQAATLTVFGVLRLVPIGVDTSSFPQTEWWAVFIKLIMTLLLASLVAALVRRIRWTPDHAETGGRT